MTLHAEGLLNSTQSTSHEYDVSRGSSKTLAVQTARVRCRCYGDRWLTQCNAARCLMHTAACTSILQSNIGISQLSCVRRILRKYEQMKARGDGEPNCLKNSRFQTSRREDNEIYALLGCYAASSGTELSLYAAK